MSSESDFLLVTRPSLWSFLDCSRRWRNSLRYKPAAAQKDSKSFFWISKRMLFGVFLIIVAFSFGSINYLVGYYESNKIYIKSQGEINVRFFPLPLQKRAEEMGGILNIVLFQKIPHLRYGQGD